MNVMQSEGLRYDVPYPDRLSRGLIFIKWLLIIPHIFVLWVLGFVFGLVSFVAWFAILITGMYPRGMWDFALRVLRWSNRVSVYMSLLRDEYPPFGDEPYPLAYELVYPDHLSRWKIFVKWVLILPHIVALYILGALSGLVTIVAWFAILFTGNYPRALFDFSVGVLRWSARVSVYMLLLTDAYPPFSLD